MMRTRKMELNALLQGRTISSVEVTPDLHETNVAITTVTLHFTGEPDTSLEITSTPNVAYDQVLLFTVLTTTRKPL